MPVDLSPVDDLNLDQELVDFAPENYCANCTHFTMKESEFSEKGDGTPYCGFYDEITRIESGMVCQHYLPTGYE